MSGGNWDDWVGRSQAIDDVISLKTASAVAATLGIQPDRAPTAGATLPYPWVWMHFLEPADRSQIGIDGHPKRGGFLPPIPHPRRMWAGSRCTFDAPLLIGESAKKVSTIQSVVEKQGRTGSMVFVTVLHTVSTGGTLAIREEQDIVYMDIPEHYVPPEGKPLPDCDHTEALEIDPVLLFRYSALTFNGHRIHYDRPYALEIERYPGLVVHGPLQATLLYDLAARQQPDRTPASFSFRGTSPLFDFDQATLNTRQTDQGTTELYAANSEGMITMKATMGWRCAS